MLGGQIKDSSPERTPVSFVPPRSNSLVTDNFTKILDKKKPTTEQNSIELLTIIPADRDTLEVLALLAGRALE